jgi:hypothetical protein
MVAFIPLRGYAARNHVKFAASDQCSGSSIVCSQPHTRVMLVSALLTLERRKSSSKTITGERREPKKRGSPRSLRNERDNSIHEELSAGWEAGKRCAPHLVWIRGIES